jgi:hypothetical protein
VEVAIYGVVLAIIIELVQGPYDIIGILLLLGGIVFLILKYAYTGGDPRNGQSD